MFFNNLRRGQFLVRKFQLTKANQLKTNKISKPKFKFLFLAEESFLLSGIYHERGL
jgi:hypothetical protein